MSDAVVLQMPTGAVGTSRTKRGLHLPSYLSSWPAQVIATFVIGLVSAAPGGLLLGRTAVVLLESLELLAENKPIMDNLQNYILDNFFFDNGNRNDHVLNMLVSVCVEVFGVGLASLSSVIGIFVGLSAYVLVIKRYGDAAMGNALTLAGTVCLMSITASGCILGLALETILSIGFPVLVVCCFTALASSILTCQLIFTDLDCHPFCKFILVFFFSPLTSLVIFIFIIPAITLSKTKLTLLFVLFPLLFIFTLSGFRHKSNIFVNMAPLPLMMILTDVFNLAKQPIAAVQSSTNPNGAVVEGLFVGILSIQLLMVVIGATLFESWQSGDASKICAGAATLGGAVLTVVEMVLYRLGPGPTIGALMGVAGAAGVSLAAAGAVTHQYGNVVKFSLGKMGEMVGVAVGAFAMSCQHSGLSSTFMVLFAATIPAGVCLQLLVLLYLKCETRLVCHLCLLFVLITLFFIYLYFTSSILGVIVFLVTLSFIGSNNQ